MKLVTSCEQPPILWRKFDWVAFDEDQMSGVCGDPDCNCRANLVRGWGETEEEAILNFVRDLLEYHNIEMKEEDHHEREDETTDQERETGATTEDTEYLRTEGPTETFVGHCPGCVASR